MWFSLMWESAISPMPISPILWVSIKVDHLHFHDNFNKCRIVFIKFSLSNSETICGGRPRAGSGVVRIDLLRFLAGYCTGRLNQALSVYHILACCIIVLWFIGAPFYVLLVFVAVCSVFWLFWLSCQYLPSDWLERPL